MGGIDWIEMTQDSERWRALMNAVMNFRVPYNVGNFLTSLEPISFARRTLPRGASKSKMTLNVEKINIIKFCTE